MCMLLLVIDIKCTINLGISKNYGHYDIFVLKQNNMLNIRGFIIYHLKSWYVSIAGY